MRVDVRLRDLLWAVRWIVGQTIGSIGMMLVIAAEWISPSGEVG